MPLRLTELASFSQNVLRRTTVSTGIWICSGSALVAEICAGSGIGFLVVDCEHGPNTLSGVLAQMQAVQGYKVDVLVRLPENNATMIKQYLDVGARNLVIPMVDSRGQAQAAVAAAAYPPAGVRGVGAALARASQWNRSPDYLTLARDSISVVVQIESAQAAAAIDSIVDVEGVDAVLVGPSDLAASLGHLGQQDDAEVRGAVLHCIDRVRRTGKPVGVNAFDPLLAQTYVAAGADFVITGADVSLLARGSDQLASAAPTRVRSALAGEATQPGASLHTRELTDSVNSEQKGSQRHG